MIAHYKHYTKQFTLTPTRKKIGKALARNCTSAYVKHTITSTANQKYVIRNVKSLVQKEVTELCRNSTLLMRSKEDLQNFSFETVTNEIARKAPVLSEVLGSCVPIRSHLERNVLSAVCIGILCKSKRPSASLLQRLCSISLYTAHCSKQVC